jgi:mRNA deadenylase 3'-5' endonuclease subunit Ccr4
MLKNLFRYKILCELNNGITVSIRRISERKMYGRNEDQYQKQHPDSFKDKRYYALERNNGDQSNPLKRDWVNVNGLPRNQGFVFTLLNYNILSQQLLEQHSYLYQEHQKNALRWNHRFYNIVGEIFRIQPDLCMFQVSIYNLFNLLKV